MFLISGKILLKEGVVLEKLNLLFIGLSSLFAFLAFSFSLYTFYKVNPPVEVIIDEKLH